LRQSAAAASTHHLLVVSDDPLLLEGECLLLEAATASAPNTARASYVGGLRARSTHLHRTEIFFINSDKSRNFEEQKQKNLLRL
jgi:hypothetical protein